MKNCDIHLGLDKKDLRDFIGSHIFEASSDEYISTIERQITELKEELKRAKISRALCDVSGQFGWEGFDVSDEIEDYKPGEYFSFVGTEMEYKKQLTKACSGSQPEGGCSR